MEFEQLYRTYFQSVYRYVLQLSGSEQLAEEITAETFFKALRGAEHFRGDCEVRVWLCQIAKNCYYSHRKKASRAVSPEEAALPDIPDPSVPMEARFSRQEDAAQLRKLLHALPDPYKEVFLWRVFGELSFREIGALYEKSDNWACVTYHRARKMIQSRWEELEHET